jgi:hypothetical protein
MTLVLPRGLRLDSGNRLYAIAGSRPTLDLRFAEDKRLRDAISLQELVTFTRGSTGTFVNASGQIETAAANVPRFQHDPLTGQCLGLLVEESRANLATNSATFQPTSGGNPASYVVDQVAPDGTTTASRQTAANPRTFVDYTGIANAQYTFSVYVRVTSGSVPLGIQLKNAATDTVVGNSDFTATTTWQRVRVTGTTAGATPGARVEVTGPVSGAPAGVVFWGAQLEAGAFPTSYIPTTAASATRSADIATITGVNFSSWYRQDEGTVFCHNSQAVTTGDVAYSYYLDAGAGAANSIYSDVTTGNRRGVVFVGGAAQCATAFGAVTAGTLARTAFGIQQDSFGLSINGNAAALDTSGTVPNPLSRMSLGNNFATNAAINGTISRLTYWGQRLPNSTLQALTA